MIVRLDLIGFANDRPRPFGSADTLHLTLPDTASVADALVQAGLDQPGLAILHNDAVLGGPNQNTTRLKDGDVLVAMMAMEGGAPEYSFFDYF